MEAGVIAVTGIFTSMLVLSVAVSIFIIVRAFQRPRRGRTNMSDAEETSLIQDIHHGLKKMEQRVESLETLLIDHDKIKRESFDRDLNKT